jgi:Mrp family chromosome partitioning ATPase
MRNSLEALYSRNAKVLGIIFNGVDPKQPEYGYYKYTEYYYSKTVSRKKEASLEAGSQPVDSATAVIEKPKGKNLSAPLPPPPVPRTGGKI